MLKWIIRILFGSITKNISIKDMLKLSKKASKELKGVRVSNYVKKP